MQARAIGVGLLVALALGLALPAAALDLDTAKRQGQVGEQTDGYVGAVRPDAPAEVRALVADVNARRQAAYEEVARKNGTPIEAVAALAGQKLIDRVPPGGWIGDGGHWYQKR